MAKLKAESAEKGKDVNIQAVAQVSFLEIKLVDDIVFSPSATTSVANMAPEGKMGRYMGFFGLTEALGWSAGPFIGGLLLDAYAMTPMALWGPIAGIGVLAGLGFRAKAWWQEPNSVAQEDGSF